MKENDLVHGEWESWCNEKIKISPSTARKHIKVFEEYKANRLTSNDLGLDALYHIATLPPEEREKEHVTSKGEMTVHELNLTTSVNLILHKPCLVSPMGHLGVTASYG